MLVEMAEVEGFDTFKIESQSIGPVDGAVFIFHHPSSELSPLFDTDKR